MTDRHLRAHDQRRAAKRGGVPHEQEVAGRRSRLAVRGPRPRPEHDEHDPGARPRRDAGRPAGGRGQRPPRRERARARRHLRRDRALHARRAARRHVRGARDPRPVPPPRPARHPARGRRARGPQPDPRPGRGRGRGHRHPGGLGRAHPLRRAQLPRLGGDDSRPSPERPQLHGPRLPAARASSPSRIARGARWSPTAWPRASTARTRARTCTSSTARS